MATLPHTPRMIFPMSKLASTVHVLLTPNLLHNICAYTCYGRHDSFRILSHEICISRFEVMNRHLATVSSLDRYRHRNVDTPEYLTDAYFLTSTGDGRSRWRSKIRQGSIPSDDRSTLAA